VMFVTNISRKRLNWKHIFIQLVVLVSHSMWRRVNIVLKMLDINAEAFHVMADVGLDQMSIV